MSMLNVQIYIKKIRHLLSGVYIYIYIHIHKKIRHLLSGVYIYIYIYIMYLYI